MRTSLDYVSRRWTEDVETFVLLLDVRVVRHTAGVLNLVRMAHAEKVGCPFPDVARHVEQTVTVGAEDADGRRTFEAVGAQVLPGELALPGVCLHFAARREVIAPNEGLALQPAASGAFQLSLRRQGFAGPLRVRQRVGVSNVRHRMPLPSANAALWAFGVAPISAGDVCPPVAEIAQIDRTEGFLEDERTRYEQGRVGAGIERRVRRLFGEGDMPCLCHKSRELGDGHRMF